MAEPLIAESFEIINGTHPELEQFRKTRTTSWDAHVKREATNFLNAPTKFEFIVGIISLHLLHPVTGLTDNLQGRNIEDIKYVKEKIDKEFDQIFSQAERIAIKRAVHPTLPRRVERQKYLNNVPAENPKKYFVRSLAIPLLDNFIFCPDFVLTILVKSQANFYFLCQSLFQKLRTKISQH